MVHVKYGSNAYARIEVERKFWLKALPGDFDANGKFTRIEDLYVTGTRLRVRRMTSPSGEVLVCKLGQKFRAEGQSAEERTMTSMYLDEGEYALLAGLPGEWVVKRRYAYQAAERRWQIDVFEDRLEGLLLAEVEARDGENISVVPVPDFAAAVVTNDPFFAGGALARLPQADFQRWLASWRET